MIRALIVDDEKITRKGMLSVIPWARFGIEIADDVASGAAALEFLAEHPVDLVFVDVAMPGMNGIELIREMRARGLECAVVVLTFYDDFEYVREAMRLGAVDYLLKTQLDDQKIIDMLGRVTVLLGRKAVERGGTGHPAYFAVVDLSGPGSPGLRAAAVTDELATVARSIGSLEEGSIILEVPSTPQAEERLMRAAAARGVTAVRLAGAPSGGQPGGEPGASPDLQVVSDAALRSIVFYEHGKNGARLVIPFERLREGPPAVPVAALEELRDGWASAGWLLLETSFQGLDEITCRLRPSFTTVGPLIRSAVSGLAGAFPSLGGALSGALGGAPSSAAPRTWTDWRLLLEGAREQALRLMQQSRHSEDTVRKVLEGLEIIRKSDGRYVKEEVVAGRVGLSRSYFSRCFKDITGVEFKKFLMDKSIAEAKSLLVSTTEPFRSISARLGYQSEAHFSRTFRSLTGLSPREFRAQHQSRQSTQVQSRGDPR